MRIRLAAALAAVVLLCAPPAMADAPMVFQSAGKVHLTCGSAGTTTGTLSEGANGDYLVTVRSETVCFCLGRSTCSDDAASGSICLTPGSGITLRNRPAGTVSCYSAGGTGILDFVRLGQR